MKKTLFSITLLISFTAAVWAAGPRTVATVNGKAITAEELTKHLWWQHATQGLSDMVDERLLLEEAARLKVTANENEVSKKLEQLRANYKNKDEFEKTLKTVNWSEKDLKNLLKNQLLIRNTVLAAGKLAITDEDAKDFYTKNKERFITPESAKLLQIFVNTKAEADDAYVALSAGADFGKLSSLKSSDATLKKNDGNLGFISKGMLQPELEKEVFALKPGEYTKPLPAGNGYTILKVEELKSPQEISYETAKEDIKANLLNQALSQGMPKLVAELRAKAKVEVVR
ncbi:MAG TPA: hypothetical protein DCL44_09630 [Elusimicrobia bacterium]|nr:hypothetical protein [Elusimicrobiota bacterium]